MTLAIASVAVIMSACKKEDEPQADNGNPTEFNSQLNDEIVSRLVGFNKLVTAYRENPSAMKSDETMPADEAVANISDLFNVVYGQATERYETTTTHEFTVSIPLTNDGEIFATDVAAAYEEVIAAAREAFANDGILENKGYLCLSAEAVPSRDGNLAVKFTGTSGKISNNHPTYSDEPFVDGDDWEYGEGLGRCSGGGIGDAADSIFQRTINFNYGSLGLSLPEPPGIAGHWEYVDIVRKEFDGSDLRYNTVFYRPVEEGTCICWEDMNRYYNAELDCLLNLIFEYESDVQGLDFVNVQIVGKQTRDESYYFHENTAFYGRLVYVYDSVICKLYLLDE